MEPVDVVVIGPDIGICAETSVSVSTDPDAGMSVIVTTGPTDCGADFFSLESFSSWGLTNFRTMGLSVSLPPAVSSLLLA